MPYSARASRCLVCRRAAVVLLGLGISLGGWPAPAAAQQATPTTPAAAATVPFTGAVFSDAGQALAGATVELVGKPLSTVTTNAEGFFLLPLPPNTPVQLIVKFPGHEPQQVTLRAPEAEKNLVVTLQRAASGRSVRKLKIKRP